VCSHSLSLSVFFNEKKVVFLTSAEASGGWVVQHGEWQSLATTDNWDHAICAGHNTGMLKIFFHCLFQPLSRSNNAER
jgi:hypothetical protein